MRTYVYDPEQGRMVCKATGLPMVGNSEAAQPLQAPRVFGDYEGYQSPVTGEWVEGKRARRNDLERHNCVDANELKPYGFERKLKNKRFAEKRGLTHMLSDEAREQ